VGTLLCLPTRFRPSLHYVFLWNARPAQPQLPQPDRGGGGGGNLYRKSLSPQFTTKGGATKLCLMWCKLPKLVPAKVQNDTTEGPEGLDFLENTLFVPQMQCLASRSATAVSELHPSKDTPMGALGLVNDNCSCIACA